MNPYLIWIAVGFQALSLGAFMVNQSIGSVALFALGTAGQAFLVWLDRNKVEESDALKARISALEGSLSVLAMKAQNW